MQIRAVNAVCRRYGKALSGATHSVAAFESMNSSASQESIDAWSAEEKRAQRERVQDVTVMDIYDIKVKQRKPDHHHTLVLPDIGL
jgi:hypothetical protein